MSRPEDEIDSKHMIYMVATFAAVCLVAFVLVRAVPLSVSSETEKCHEGHSVRLLGEGDNGSGEDVSTITTESN